MGGHGTNGRVHGMYTFLVSWKQGTRRLEDGWELQTGEHISGGKVGGGGSEGQDLEKQGLTRDSYMNRNNLAGCRQTQPKMVQAPIDVLANMDELEQIAFSCYI